MACCSVKKKKKEKKKRKNKKKKKTTDDALMRFLQRECLTLTDRLATAFSARALRSGCGLTAFPWSRGPRSESEPP
eukprot:1517595-Amphidinium_carterae.1